MTTETTQDPQAPQPTVMDITEVYRLLGRLEEGQLQTKEQLIRLEQRQDRNEERTGQRFDRHEERTEQRFDRHEERNDQQLAEVNRRIDRLWYTIVGGAVAILAGMAGLAVQNALIG